MSVQLKVKDLRDALASVPDHFDVQLVVDMRSFASWGLGSGSSASSPLVRVSPMDETARKHERVWLYGRREGT